MQQKVQKLPHDEDALHSRLWQGKNLHVRHLPQAVRPKAFSEAASLQNPRVLNLTSTHQTTILNFSVVLNSS